jgi:hypothetical protein
VSLTAKFGGGGGRDVPSARFHELIARSHIRFILTLNNVSTHHSFSPFCLNGGDYENSHATAIRSTVRGSHDALDAQAARDSNHGGTLVVDGDRVGPGFSISGSPQPDRQGVADARPTLRIPHIHRRTASTVVGEGPQAAHKGRPARPQRAKGRGVRFSVR